MTDVKGNSRDILKGVSGYVEPNHMMVGGRARWRAAALCAVQRAGRGPVSCALALC